MNITIIEDRRSFGCLWLILALIGLFLWGAASRSGKDPVAGEVVRQENAVRKDK